MSSLATGFLTPEEFIAFERAAETKHEYHDGIVVAMSGGGMPHSRLAVQLASELWQRLKRRGCLVFNSDMRVWTGESRHYFYPDVSGLCGHPQFQDEARDVLLNPAFIVEVLSPSTASYDRGKKLAHYMGLLSVVDIAFVNQDDIRVDKYTRQPDGIWRFDVFSGMEAVVPFVSVQCDIRLGDFYEGVELLPLLEPGLFRFREDEPGS